MTIGQYELLEAVGKGGMSTVYRARHRDTGKIVAVKLMSPEMVADPVLLGRFEQECAAARRLRHPHIVQGLDFGLEEGQPYLVMEFVEGQTLGQRVRQQGPLTEVEAIRVIRQIADALQLAHEHRLIHRDVKPENILLTAAGQAKLTDLGLIKDLDTDGFLTRPRTGLGTIVFMAPEQFEDAKQADARSDVYGLGATLYYLLTGVVPFPGRGNLTILKKKMQNDFLPPRRIVAALREQVDRAVCMALDANLARRPRSCVEFAALLPEVVLAEDPVEVAEVMVEPDAETQQLVDPHDRRAALRYPSTVKASCRFPHRDRHPSHVEVQDVSLTGICLQLDSHCEPGTDFSVAVQDE